MALVLLGALAASAACGDGGDDPAAGVGPPGRVLLVGDSLFFQSGQELRASLEGDGWEVTLAAEPGAGLGGGGYGDIDWPDRLDRALDGIEPEVAVVELGTNGCGRRCSSPDAAIADVLERLEEVPLVLWLTVRTDAPRPTGAPAINDALRRAAADRDGLEVLPYDDWLDGAPGLVSDDGVHLTPAGQRAVAVRVLDAVRRHAARRPRRRRAVGRPAGTGGPPPAPPQALRCGLPGGVRAPGGLPRLQSGWNG